MANGNSNTGLRKPRFSFFLPKWRLKLFPVPISSADFDFLHPVSLYRVNFRRLSASITEFKRLTISAFGLSNFADQATI